MTLQFNITINIVSLFLEGGGRWGKISQKLLSLSVNIGRLVIIFLRSFHIFSPPPPRLGGVGGGGWGGGGGGGGGVGGGGGGGARACENED
jgi:hypothetical protein